jgi:EmrB/QacA subfamily drug resistance transporter
MQETNESTAKHWVLGITSLASFMMALDAMVITTAFATIRAEFGASVETLQWTVNAFNLTFAVLLLSGAALGDRFGRRNMFAAGIALFVAASIACALAPSAEWLIASRALQGAGAALVMPLAMAILSGAFPKEERARALGIFSGITGCALIIGPAVGGFLTASLGWRFIFWINVPIGLVLIALAIVRLRESFGPQARLDITGLALVAAAALALVWGLIRGNRMGWSSVEVTGALTAGVVFAFAFVLYERRAAAPMIPMRLFASRPFSAGAVSSFLFYAAMYGVLFLLPQFLQVTLGFGPLGAGLRLLPWTSTLFLTAPVAGAVVQRFGERQLVVTGLLMQAAGLGWIAFEASAGAAYPMMVAPLIIAGVGVSMAMPAAQNAILSSVAVTEMGKASGIFNMGRFLGGMFGIALMVAVFSAHGAADTPTHFASGFAAAMAVAAILSLLAAFAGGFLPARRTVAQLKPQQA